MIRQADMKTFLLLLLLLGAMTVHAQEVTKDQAAPEYATLVGEGLSGSAFHFAVGTKRYVACSLHQFEGMAPRHLISMDFDGDIEVKQRLFTGKDTQVLRYISAELDKLEPLKFDPQVTPAVGDKVWCYHFDTSYEGQIISISPDKRDHTIRMSQPYPAAGNRGGPVVSAVSGTVIGVVLTGNDAKAATIIGFELLKLDTPSAPGPGAVPAVSSGPKSAGSSTLSKWDHALLLLKAQALQHAIDSGDADAIIRSTHPAIAKLFDSREQFEAITRKMAKTVGSQLTFEELDWGVPTPLYLSGTDEVCFLPKTTLMRVGDKRARTVGFQIAARQKGSQNWLFLDSNNLSKDPSLLWQMFPGLPKDVVTPPTSVELLK